jgi:hypothetical protein
MTFVPIHLQLKDVCEKLKAKSRSINWRWGAILSPHVHLSCGLRWQKRDVTARCAWWKALAVLPRCHLSFQAQLALPVAGCNLCHVSRSYEKPNHRLFVSHRLRFSFMFWRYRYSVRIRSRGLLSWRVLTSFYSSPFRRIWIAMDKQVGIWVTSQFYEIGSECTSRSKRIWTKRKPLA